MKEIQSNHHHIVFSFLPKGNHSGLYLRRLSLQEELDLEDLKTTATSLEGEGEDEDDEGVTEIFKSVIHYN